MRQVLPILRSATLTRRAKVVFCGIEIDERLQALCRAQSADLLAVPHITELGRQFDDADWGCIICGDESASDDAIDAIATFIDEHEGFCWILWASGLPLAAAVAAMQRGALNVLCREQDNADLSALSTSIADAIRLAHERFLDWRDAREVKRRFAELSESERRVLALVMQGMTNKEISLQLDFSLRTVESRRQRILRLMQTENAITLAALLARHGMLDQVVAFCQGMDAAASHSASA